MGYQISISNIPKQFYYCKDKREERNKSNGVMKPIDNILLKSLII